MLRPDGELAVRIDCEAARRRMSAPQMILAMLDTQCPAVEASQREPQRLSA